MPEPQRPTLYLSPKESGAHVGVSVDTIRRRIADGTIPAHRLGRLIKIHVDDLEAAFRRIPAGGGPVA